MSLAVEVPQEWVAVLGAFAPTEERWGLHTWEIAEAWGVSESMARSRISRLRRLGVIEAKHVRYANDLGQMVHGWQYRVKGEASQEPS